jgi:hypothetical protein
VPEVYASMRSGIVISGMQQCTAGSSSVLRVLIVGRKRRQLQWCQHCYRLHMVYGMLKQLEALDAWSRQYSIV